MAACESDLRVIRDFAKRVAEIAALSEEYAA